MHRGGVPTPLSLRFFGTHRGSILPHCFGIVFETDFGHLLVPKLVPKWQQNRFNFRTKIALPLVARFFPFRIKCFLQTTTKTLFSNGFSAIFVYTHAAVIFHCVMLVLLELGPWWPFNVIKMSSKLVYQIVSQLARFGVSFWLDLGTLLEALWGPNPPPQVSFNF